jgi:HlyD family secretion protein
VFSQIVKRPIVIVLLLALLLGCAIWYGVKPPDVPPGFARGNGRIEAVEIDVAAKTAGRVLEILADEGSFISAGQVLARMDTAVLSAQLREAQAQFEQAKIGVDTAHSLVAQRLAEKDAADAVVAQRQAEKDAADKRLARTEQLAARGNASVQQLDDDRADAAGRKAALSAAIAQVSAVEAGLGAARAQVIAAEAAVAAGMATVERIQADIDDSELRSPRDGRIQYRVAQPGEVLGAGGAVLNLVDLSDVYMTFFLPTAEAGRAAIGAEAHIILDAAPDYVIPAEISLVSDVAQFTPKTVETAEEREKLMFRLKARIDKALLQKHLEQVKTGLPGVVYVRLDRNADWPEALQVRLPE